MKLQVTGVEFALSLTPRQWSLLPDFESVEAWCRREGVEELDNLEWDGHFGYFLFFRIRKESVEALTEACKVQQMLQRRLK